MEAKLGQFVVTERHQHRGRIYSKHHDFKGTGEPDSWFNIQDPRIPESKKSEPWYDILCKDGGAITVPESDILEIEEPYELKNIWEDFYF